MTWETILQTATNQHHEGNYKDAYSNYVKAAQAVLSKLGSEVVFDSRDSVKSNQITRLLQKLNHCVQNVEDILLNLNAALPSPQPSYISDTAPSTHTINNANSRVPLVPLSPLTRQSVKYAQNLLYLNNKVNNAKQKNAEGKSNDGSAIQKGMDEIRVAHSKLDDVSNQISVISEEILLYWNADDVAKQLTIIDSDLFGKIKFRKDFKANNSRTQACLDFHRYLVHSFSHQFIIYADTMQAPGGLSRSSHHGRENIISQALKIAYYLLHVYRNFNSFAALIKALSAKEVLRIRRLWANQTTRTNQLFKEFVGYINPASDYKAYREMLAQKLDNFRDAGQGMSAIPWMQPHYQDIKKVMLGRRIGQFSDQNAIFALLEQCKSNTVPPYGEERSAHWNRSHGSRNRTVTIDGNPIALTSDLSTMGWGNKEVHHWLVSRVYLTKKQLVRESIEVEPLGKNEPEPSPESECEDEEEDIDDQISLSREDSGSDEGDSEFVSGLLLSGSHSKDVQTTGNKLVNLPEPYALPNVLNDEQNGESSTKAGSLLTKPIKADDHKFSGKTTNFLNGIDVPSDPGTSSSTPAIAIPQSSHSSHSRPTQSSLPSDSSKGISLNPNAPAFVPRSHSYTKSGFEYKSSSTPSAAINVSVNEPGGGAAQITLGFVPVQTGATDDEEKFVYTSSDPTVPAEEEEKFLYQKGDDDDERFVYPQQDSDTNEDDDDHKFVYLKESAASAKENGDAAIAETSGIADDKSKLFTKVTETKDATSGVPVLSIKLQDVVGQPQ